MVGGGHAAVDGLTALHALRPCWGAVGAAAGRTGSSRCAGAALGRTAAHDGAFSGGEALFQAGRRAAQRAHRDGSRRLGDARRAAGPVGGGRTAGHRSARASRSGDGATRRGEPACSRGDSGGADARHREASPNGGARAELGAAGDQAVGNTGAEDGQAKQRQRCEDERQRVGNRGRIIEARGELAEDRGADADDDGEHQNLDAGRHHVAEHALGEETRCGRTVRRGRGRTRRGSSA